jgi:hypothetical protein
VILQKPLRGRPFASVPASMLVVEPQQIEGMEPWFATPEQQVFEQGFVMAVEAGDLAVESC